MAVIYPQFIPYFDTGYASGPGDSLYPNLWDGLVMYFMPSAGYQGHDIMRDFSGNNLHAYRQGTYTTYNPYIHGEGLSSVHNQDIWWQVPNNSLLNPLGGTGSPRSWMFWIYYTASTNRLVTDKSNFQGRTIWSEVQSGYIAGGTHVTGAVRTPGTLGTGWHHITFVHSTSSMTSLFLDGQLVDGPQTNTSIAVNTESLRILGAALSGAYNYPYPIDDLRFYRRALDEREIYNSAVLNHKPLDLYRPGRKYGFVPVISSPAGISVIKSSGGDYASLTLWEADQTDPVGDVTASIEEAYSAGTNVVVNFSNSNSVATTITVAEGYRAYNQSSWGSDDNAAISSAASVAGLTINMAAQVIVKHLVSVAGSTDGFTSSNGNCYFYNCIAYGTSGIGFLASGGNVYFSYCLVFGVTSGFVASSGTSVTAYASNCLAFDCTNAGFNRLSHTFNTNNCIALDSSIVGDFSSTSGNYNMSSDISAPGANSWHSVDSAAILTDTTPDSEVFHWNEANINYYIGDIGNSDWGIDISGRRVQAGYIGCFERATVLSVIASTGGDYATAALWEADIPTDPINVYMGICTLAESAGSPTINVSNSNNVRIILTADGNRFIDGAGWPNCGSAEGQGTSLGTVSITTTNVLLEWFEITGSITMSGSANDCMVRTCLVHDCVDGITNSAGNNIVYGCFVYNCSSDGIIRSGGSPSFYNNTVFGCAGIGISSSSGNVYNNICLSNGTDFFVTATADFNMSSDATAPGTTTMLSRSPASVIANTTATTEDLHLTSKNVGYDDITESVRLGIPGTSISIYPVGSTTPVGEEVDKAIDGILTNKYTNNSIRFTGFEITVLVAQKIFGAAFTSSPDTPDHDPNSWVIMGNPGGGAPWVYIASGELIFSSRSETIYAIFEDISASYANFLIFFPTVVGASATAMQIGEVALLTGDPAVGQYFEAIGTNVDIDGNVKSTWTMGAG